MLNNIEKKCIVGNDIICITLVDIRDNYVIKDAIGTIGNIFISNHGVFIYPDYDSEDKIIKKKEVILIQNFKELFGVDEYNPVSSEYYQKIKEMISNEKLKSLGYVVEEDLDFDLFEFTKFDDTNWHNISMNFVESIPSPSKGLRR